MTATTTLPALAPGDQIHALLSGFIWRLQDPNTRPSIARTADLRRGQTITLTSEQIRANADLLAVIDDPEAQTRRWGAVVAARGAFPETLATYTRGTVEEDIERDRQFHDAGRITDPAKRAARLQEIRRQFPTPTSVQTSESVGDDGIDRYGLTAQQRHLRDLGLEY